MSIIFTGTSCTVNMGVNENNTVILIHVWFHCYQLWADNLTSYHNS